MDSAHVRQSVALESQKETIDELVNDLFAKLGSGKVTWQKTNFSVTCKMTHDYLTFIVVNKQAWLCLKILTGDLREPRDADKEDLQDAAWHYPAPWIKACEMFPLEWYFSIFSQLVPTISHSKSKETNIGVEWTLPIRRWLGAGANPSEMGVKATLAASFAFDLLWVPWLFGNPQLYCLHSVSL